MSRNSIWNRDDAWQALRWIKPCQPDTSGTRRIGIGDGLLTMDSSGGWSVRGVSLSDAAYGLLDRLAPAAAGPSQRFAIGQMAQSLDGRTATARGQGDRITGEADHQRLHQLRALVDAVIVGSATALADNPRLTVRAVEGEQPVRVVLDRCRRLPRDHSLFLEPSSPTLRVVATPDSDDDNNTLVIRDMTPAAVLDRLAERGLARVLVEGGGRTVSRFLNAGCLDRLHLAIAPVLVGRGAAGIDLPPLQGMDQARRPVCRQHQLGEDVLFDLDLHRERPSPE